MKIEGLEVRYTVMEDQAPLKKWLLEPGVLRGFPMKDEREVDDAIRHWIGFSKFRSSLTALLNKEPCGIATLNLMPYRKLAHHCLLSIIVTEEERNKGIGTYLMNNVMHLAKEYFGIEVLYLEVYEGNPAVSLYKRFGFKQSGFQKHFLKDDGEYIGKITMERVL